MESNNLYKKIDSLEKTDASFGDELTEDQKKIVNAALSNIEKAIAQERNILSYKAKLNPFSDELKRSIDAISYNTLNIRHIKVKLGISKTSKDQGGQ